MAGGVFSGAKLHGMTIRESADDGSDFTNPDADYRRLFLGEDGKLHLKDSAGSVTDIGGSVDELDDIGDVDAAAPDDGDVLTWSDYLSAWVPEAPAAGGGDVATDTIWDAAGDLAVGSGSNTAAKLAIGAAGGALSVINSAVAWNSGTSFPASKATGDRYWRTDLGMEFYWDGTRWVSTAEYRADFRSNEGISATTDSRVSFLTTGLDLWVERAILVTYVNGTSDGSNYWTITFRKYTSANSFTNIHSAATSGDTTNVHTEHGDAAVDEVLDVSTYFGVSCNAVKTAGSPGNLYMQAALVYRLIAT